MSRAQCVHDHLLRWLKQNQRELEVGDYSKISLEIIVSVRTRRPVKLRSLITHEADLTELAELTTKRDGAPG
jgi:hypothetical protein